MSGIAGYYGETATTAVPKMLDLIAHRGQHGRTFKKQHIGSMGAVWTDENFAGENLYQGDPCVEDRRSPDQFALAAITDNGLLLQRGTMGVAPLYYGKDDREEYILLPK